MVYMFSIQVLSAFYLKSLDVVAINGKVKGRLNAGQIIFEEDNKNNKYITKGLILPNTKILKSDIIDIQLETGDYDIENLIGKTLVSH